MQSVPSPASRATRAAKFGAGLLVLGAGVMAGAPVSAQDLTHRFLNPAFGGNPFNADYLLGVAAIHRPEAPEEPAAEPPTEEELLAAQLRSQFLSQLTGDIRQRVQNAQPGESGEFELGDQRISFTRTATETQITFLNTRTNESSRVVLPADPSDQSFALASQSLSAEQMLGASSAVSGLLAGGSLAAQLDSRSLEIPLRGY